MHCPEGTACKLAAQERGFDKEGEAPDTGETILLWNEDVGIERYTRAALESSGDPNSSAMGVLRALSNLSMPLEIGTVADKREWQGTLGDRNFTLMRDALSLEEVDMILEASRYAGQIHNPKRTHSHTNTRRLTHKHTTTHFTHTLSGTWTSPWSQTLSTCFLPITTRSSRLASWLETPKSLVW